MTIWRRLTRFSTLLNWNHANGWKRRDYEKLSEPTLHTHPTFPFITIELALVENSDEVEISSSVDDWLLQAPYRTCRTTRAEDPADVNKCIADALRSAEWVFFFDQCDFSQWRRKIEDAAKRGDLPMLCTLAEGRGYWNGVNASLEPIHTVLDAAQSMYYGFSAAPPSESAALVVPFEAAETQ